jgi:hypothetical protein
LGAKILSQVAQGKEIQAVAGKFRASRRFFPQPALMFAVKPLDVRDFPGCAQTLIFGDAQGRRQG